MTTPPAIIQRAAVACADQTWFHPEREGRVVLRRGDVVVRLACRRTEGNALIVDRVAVDVAETLADPMQLVALEQVSCAPFPGSRCEVNAL